MTNFTFSPPANISDFPKDSSHDKRMRTIWNWNLTGYTLTGIVGDPWNACSDSHRYFYFDPTKTSIPDNEQQIPIKWIAFPNRVKWYFSADGGSPGNPYQLKSDEVLELADTGKIRNKTDFKDGFPLVPRSACPVIDWNAPKSEWRTFGPRGPRGWQDEYCEWSVKRDPTSNKITSVMFTCENPDYWFTLWQVDPRTVLNLYQQIISPNVTFEDLCLTDDNGQPVINPLTGQPAYNPINKWNSGTATNPGISGGAVHLTSTPNTLGAEVYLAAAATLLRNVDNYTAQDMVCCSRYGQPYRNSDPNIGFNANQLAKLGYTISLADPVGLYIQMPDFTTYKTPDGTSASEFWTVTRGNGPDKILHAVFEVPSSKGYTVGDIIINDSYIEWGGQIAQTLQIQLMATAFSDSTLPPQQSLPCQGDLGNPTPQAIALIPNNLLIAYNNLFTIDGVVTNSPVLPAPIVAQGQTVELALQCSDVTANPVISFGDGVVVTIVSEDSPDAAAGGARATADIAIRTFQLAISVSIDATLGQRSITVTNPGQSSATPAPAFLTIVPANWSAIS